MIRRAPLLLAWAALVGCASAPIVAPPETVVVQFEIKYKNDGKFKKLKVKSSNGGIFKPSRGHICYDETKMDLCKKGREDWELTWKAHDLKPGQRLEIDSAERLERG